MQTFPHKKICCEGFFYPLFTLSLERMRFADGKTWKSKDVSVEPHEGRAQPVGSPRHSCWAHTQSKLIFYLQNTILILFQALYPRLSGESVCALIALPCVDSKGRAPRVAASDRGWGTIWQEKPSIWGLSQHQPQQVTPAARGTSLIYQHSQQDRYWGGWWQELCSLLSMDVPAHSQLKVRKKTAARTQLPMTPKITVSPSALPRNRIWNHSILAKLEFA